MEIASDPEHYGFDLPPNSPFRFDEVLLRGPVDLKLVSGITAIPFDELQNLNPMFVRHRAVMGAEQPALQERHDLMDVRQELRGRPGLPLEERDPVPVAVAPQRLVAEPPVGGHATPGGNGRLNEGHQAPRRRIDKSPQPGSTYRVGIAANWIDDPSGGDVFVLSRAVRATS